MHSKVFVYSCLVVLLSGASGNLMQGKCKTGYKECENGDDCVLNSLICDGIPTCLDKSDEKYCIGKPNPMLYNKKLVKGNCLEGYLECETGEICLENKYLCDGNVYCPDESDEKYCVHNTTEFIETTTMYEAMQSSLPTESEELSSEKEHGFDLPDSADHCKSYKRMINLVRKAHIRLSRLDKRTAKVIENLINEILMEADMENYLSLLELHNVCQDLARHHHTTTQPSPTSTTQGIQI